MASHRMHRGLVALSASAVAAIYMVGYMRTQAAEAGIEAAAAEPPPATSRLSQSPTATPVIVARAAPTSSTTSVSPSPTDTPLTVARPTATQAAPPAPAIQSSGAYKDGTYTGQGSSRRGDVWVSVQVLRGQITNVTITRSTLQYPLRDIANLPSQVVQRQSAQVDTVSRATYSSQAFRGAVTQALASAKA